MGLTCGLPPAVVAEMYEQIRAWVDRGKLLEAGSRLELAGIDDDWIDFAVERYRRLAGVEGYEVIDEEHAGLVSWVLAGEVLHHVTPAEFEAELLDRVNTVEGGSDVILVGWVVGRRSAVEYWGQRVLAVPSVRPSDPSVALAFLGLAEHAASIAVQRDVGELARTSIVTRLGGLVDALSKPRYPRAEDEPPIDTRFGILRSEIRSSLGPAENIACDKAVDEFNSVRNVLVHVHQGSAPKGFPEYVELFDSREELAARLTAATAIVFGHAALELTRDDSPWLLNAVNRRLEEAEWVDHIG